MRTIRLEMTTGPIDDDSFFKLTAARARKIARDPSQAGWALLRLSALARERGSAEPAGAAKPDLSAPCSMVAPFAKPNSTRFDPRVSRPSFDFNPKSRI